MLLHNEEEFIEWDNRSSNLGFRVECQLDALSYFERNGKIFEHFILSVPAIFADVLWK